MKYMHSEWQRRLAHWQHTLQMDFYFPLGSIDVESFFTTEHLTPEEAQSRHFEPMSAGTTWGHSYEYCWMHSKVILPVRIRGRGLGLFFLSLLSGIRHTSSHIMLIIS